MTQVEKLHHVTEQLFCLIDNPIQEEKREQIIEQLSNLLEVREEIFPDIKPPFSQNERKYFKQIIEWNKKIDLKFAELQSQIKQDMMRLKKVEASNKKYANPYQSVTTSDGMFYDKRSK